MSLESKLDSLIEAVNGLSKVIAAQSVAAHAAKTAAPVVETVIAPAAPVAAPVVAAPAPLPIPVPPVAAPVVAPAPVVAAPVVAPAPTMPPPPSFIAPTAPPLTAPAAAPFTDAKGLVAYVMATYQQLGPQKGAAIQGVLTSIGYNNISDVKPEHYGALYAGIEALK